jgi:hypothetical protein
MCNQADNYVQSVEKEVLALKTDLTTLKGVAVAQSA